MPALFSSGCGVRVSITESVWICRLQEEALITEEHLLTEMGLPQSVLGDVYGDGPPDGARPPSEAGPPDRVGFPDVPEPPDGARPDRDGAPDGVGPPDGVEPPCRVGPTDGAGFPDVAKPPMESGLLMELDLTEMALQWCRAS